jgi:hypothetical protein
MSQARVRQRASRNFCTGPKSQKIASENHCIAVPVQSLLYVITSFSHCRILSIDRPDGCRPAGHGTDADSRRVALEVIATLVNVKRIAADLVLRPVGIPDDLIRRFLRERDPTTHDPLTKRQAGALILDELGRGGEDRSVIRNLLELAAGWDGFHLAQDEYKARAVAQKARELTGVLAEADAREGAEQERIAEERAKRHRRDREADLRRQSELLLAQFDQASVDGEPHQRGYLLQDLLNRTFDLHGIPVARSFQRNSSGEQIDGAFEMESWHYIVECRWRSKLADIRELDGLYGQVARSGRQTMGLFLSINGWSENVVPLMKQNPDKSIILMEGYELRTVLEQTLDLRQGPTGMRTCS